MNILLRSPSIFSSRIVPISFGLRRYYTTAIDTQDIKRLRERLLHDPNGIYQRMCDGQTPLHYLAGACPYSGLRLPIGKEPPKKFTQVFLSGLKKKRN